jgi:hypothetical protein
MGEIRTVFIMAGFNLENPFMNVIEESSLQPPSAGKVSALLPGYSDE